MFGLFFFTASLYRPTFTYSFLVIFDSSFKVDRKQISSAVKISFLQLQLLAKVKPYLKAVFFLLRALITSRFAIYDWNCETVTSLSASTDSNLSSKSRLGKWNLHPRLWDDLPSHIWKGWKYCKYYFHCWRATFSFFLDLSSISHTIRLYLAFLCTCISNVLDELNSHSTQTLTFKMPNRSQILNESSVYQWIEGLWT